MRGCEGPFLWDHHEDHSVFDFIISSPERQPTKTDGASADRGYITAVTSHRAIGKRFVIRDGVSEKTRLKNCGRLIARTVRCRDLEDLASVLKSLTSKQALIKTFVRATENLSNFWIVTEKDIQKIVDVEPDQPRPAAVRIKVDNEWLLNGRVERTSQALTRGSTEDQRIEPIADGSDKPS